MCCTLLINSCRKSKDSRFILWYIGANIYTLNVCLISQSQTVNNLGLLGLNWENELAPADLSPIGYISCVMLSTLITTDRCRRKKILNKAKNRDRTLIITLMNWKINWKKLITNNPSLKVTKQRHLKKQTISVRSHQ